MLRLIFLIVLFWMSHIRVMAQNPTVSELRSNFEQAEPAKKLGAAVELLNEYFYSGNLRDGVDFGEKFLLTLDTTQTSQPLAQIHNRLGTLYTSLGDHEYLAVFHLNRSLEVSRNLNWLLGISTALNNLGNIYREMGYYARAHEFYTQSIEVCERDEDSLGLSYAYKNLGLLAEDQGWKHKAFDYHLKAYQIRKLLGRKREILSSLLSLGIVLNADQKYDSALIFLESAEGLARVLNSEMQSEVALEQGEAYAHLNQMGIALNKYDEALTKAVTYKKSRAIANILIHKIDILLVNHMLEQSEANLAILKKHLDTTRYVTGKINFYDLSH